MVKRYELSATLSVFIFLIVGTLTIINLKLSVHSGTGRKMNRRKTVPMFSKEVSGGGSMLATQKQVCGSAVL